MVAVTFLNPNVLLGSDGIDPGFIGKYFNSKEKTARTNMNMAPATYLKACLVGSRMTRIRRIDGYHLTKLMNPNPKIVK